METVKAIQSPEPATNQKPQYEQRIKAVTRELKERKRVDVLLAAEFTVVVRGLDTHVIDINAMLFLFVIISELFFFDSTHWIYQ